MTPEQYNQQILSALLQLQRDVAAIKDAVLRGGGGSGGGSQGGSGRGEGAIADDRDLDGQHGDPTIKFDPSAKYWNATSYEGYHFSETEPDYLDAMAKYLDACAYMAEKDSDERKRKSAIYKRKDAARARGWAQRLRARGNGGGGGHARGNGGGGGSRSSGPASPPPAEDYGGFANEDDVPF